MNLKYFLFTVFFFFLLFGKSWGEASFAQSRPVGERSRTIDSLLTLLKTDKPDTNKVIHLNKLSREYISIYQYDTALHYGKLALQMSQQLNFNNGIVSSYYTIGLVYDYQGNYQKALKNYFDCLKMSEEIGDKASISRVYNIIGIVYKNQGNYPEALKTQFASLKIKEEIGDKNGIAISYSNIGVIYEYQGNFSEALKSYEAALAIKEYHSSKQSVAITYSNIGNIYLNQENYPAALKNYFASLKMFEDLKDKQHISSTYHNIGVIYYYQGDYSEALKKLFASLKIYEDIGDKQGVGYCYISLGEIYTKLNKPETARDYLNKALKIFVEMGNKESIKSSYNWLEKLDSTQGNWKAAYRYHKLFMLYKDSIDNEETKKKIMQSTMTYEFEKKEAITKAAQDKKNAVAEENNRKQQIVIRSVVAGLLIMMLFAAFVYNRYLVISKQSKIIEEQRKKIEAQQEQEKIVLEQKLLRSQMNPHFIFNSLDAIQSFIYNKKNNDAITYLSKFGKLTRQILENSREEYVSLENELSTLDNFLALQQLLFEKKFNYNITIDDDIEQDVLMIPPMLAQPFIENSLKHGISYIEGKGQIEVNFYLRSGKLIFEVMDNGIGLEKAKEINKIKNNRHRSLATTITEERLENINKNRADKIAILLIDILNEKHEIIGAKLSFEIPYIYAC